MKKIILFPGTMDSPFFLNEIEYIKKEFEIVKVFTYQGDLKKFEEISKKYKFSYEIIPNIKFSSLFSFNFIKWFFSKAVLKEIKKNFSFTKKGIEKLKYILFYGNFCISSYERINEVLKKIKENKIYFYSFWLSRGAYTISYFKSQNKGSNLIIKTISRAHRYDLYEERNGLNYLPFREYINNNLDKIYFISENGKKYFEEKYNFNSMNKYFVSKLGTENKLSLKKIIKEKEKICIASCSSIIDVKRLDLIIDILSQLNIDFYWVHIGTGELEEKIRKYASKKLKKENYKFLGRIDNSKILQTYIDYDVDYFINMSDSEGIPVSIMEAISLGIPCIARNVGGNPEVVNNEYGLLLNDIKNEYINEFLSLRLQNTKKYQELSINSLEKWKKDYNAERNYIDFFKHIEL